MELSIERGRKSAILLGNIIQSNKNNKQETCTYKKN